MSTTAKNEFTVLIAFIALVMGIILFSGIALGKKSAEVDAYTKVLCQEYAARDHEKEIAPARYQYLGKEFVDNFDWYQSCIDHSRYPVATERK